jgi:hypothetical protein
MLLKVEEADQNKSNPNWNGKDFLYGRSLGWQNPVIGHG